MCGLAGMYTSNFIQDEIKDFNNLLMLNVFRGRDATGVMTANDKGDYSWFKNTTPSPSFIYDEEYREWQGSFQKEYKPRFWAGHTRASTVGSSSDVDNAHPFENEELVGMHNGTIDFSLLPPNTTDSQYLFECIHELGLRQTLLEVENINSQNLKYYEGAYSIVYYDKKENTLNFIRNKYRPMYFCVEYDSVLYWSSDIKPIQFMKNIHSANLKVPSVLEKKPLINYKTKEGIPRYFQLKPGVLMTINLSSLFLESFSFNTILSEKEMF